MRRSSALLLTLVLATGSLSAQKRSRLPRERKLDAGVELKRDPATGELRYRRAARPDASAAAEESSPAPIRVRVNLVELSVNVLQPNGDHLLGLTRDDFRIYENGVPQATAHFDASTEPASVALIAENLRAQYTLGYYSSDPAKPGWRALRVEVTGRNDVRIPHRAAYYVPANP